MDKNEFLKWYPKFECGLNILPLKLFSYPPPLYPYLPGINKLPELFDLPEGQSYINAWGLFGAAFSPVVLLSLYYKKMTYYGAVAGIFAGAVTDILWKLFLFNSTKLYEIIPGFLVGFIVVVVVSKFTKKSSKIEQLFDESVSHAN